jgi:hypothetical protein
MLERTTTPLSFGEECVSSRNAAPPASAATASALAVAGCDSIPGGETLSPSFETGGALAGGW